jgi:tetratricopeptide (TPR) repeat protein
MLIICWWAISKDYYSQHLAISDKSYWNLCNVYQSLGTYSEAIEYHTQCLAIAEEVCDRAGEGRAYGNLGISYTSLGDFSKAIEYHTQCLAIAKEWVGPGRRGVREPRDWVSGAGGL